MRVFALVKPGAVGNHTRPGRKRRKAMKKEPSAFVIFCAMNTVTRRSTQWLDLFRRLIELQPCRRNGRSAER